MSGHSKWSQIKRDKGANDSKRSQVFTKLGAAITIAVKQGGGISDPDDNPRLRMIIEKARGLNMPHDNINRAIERGAGPAGGVSFDEVVYEGYGPNGIAIIVTAVTDNKARTFADIRNIFDKNGGTMASTGAVSYLFKQVGYIRIKKSGRSFDDLFLIAADAGAEDAEEGIDSFEIYTIPGDLNTVKQKLEKSQLEVIESEFSRKPINLVVVDDENLAVKIISFIERLEENDDVQKVYANFDMTDEVLAKISSS